MYTYEHEWLKIDGNVATDGITDLAQSELGDIIFLEFPSIDENLSNGDVFGTIEAVKTVSDMYMPLTGKIVAINEDLNDNPNRQTSSTYDLVLSGTQLGNMVLQFYYYIYCLIR